MAREKKVTKIASKPVAPALEELLVSGIGVQRLSRGEMLQRLRYEEKMKAYSRHYLGSPIPLSSMYDTSQLVGQKVVMDEMSQAFRSSSHLSMVFNVFMQQRRQQSYRGRRSEVQVCLDVADYIEQWGVVEGDYVVISKSLLDDIRTGGVPNAS